MNALNFFLTTCAVFISQWSGVFMEERSDDSRVVVVTISGLISVTHGDRGSESLGNQK